MTITSSAWLSAPTETRRQHRLRAGYSVSDVATGNHLQTLSGHGGAIKCLAFSPDGRQLASGSGSVGKGSRPGDPYSSGLKIWDLNTCAASDLVGHTAKVGDLAWSPNGTLLASALMGGDGTVRIWDAASLNCIKTLRGTDEGLASLAFSPDAVVTSLPSVSTAS